ncbi:LysE family transporter [Burkholderia sp. Ac-20353]|uniref:LysE family translocator n=1 Tax=Burkholderia sp. Ac-20353 TaxID=2703894 RepID=UPI00197BC243|nr:LysE family transporter [Burkholderia sp. Ac-20353]MBN3786195.1 LysE family transporter [Burkholderia sp. Ac-20353]
MSYVPQLAAVGGVMLLACVSPGPDLIAVTSHALGNRRAGLFAAMGIATSHAVWAAMAIFGLGLIVAKLAWLYEAIRIAGAAYLIYLGVKTLWSLRKSAQQPDPAVAPARSGAQAYRKGLLVGMTNPKAAAFFGSLFVTLLPAHAPSWMHGATLAIVVAVSLTWFCTMAVLFSTSRVQTGYAKLRKPIDAVMGTVLLGLGTKLALDR